MDELFSNLAIQTVQLVGKAAFGAAGTIALKRVTEYVHRVPHSAERQTEVERLRAQFEAKLRIITPAIDLIDIISARGHSTMSSVLQLTYSLRSDILAFSAKLAKLDQLLDELGPAQPQKSDKSLVSLFRRTQLPESKSDRIVALNDSIVSDLKLLLQAIEDAVPLLNLALTTSGAHLGGALPAEVSPGRLMQASALLSRATTWFNMRGGRADCLADAMVGEPFTLRLYSLFVGAVRPRARQDFTWKEECARCQVALWRTATMAPDLLYSSIGYELRILEDQNDGRYHDEVLDGPCVGAQPRWVADMAKRLPLPVWPGRQIRIRLEDIVGLHYTSAGSLLNIEDSNSPVLVISFDDSRSGEATAVASGLNIADAQTSPEKTHTSWYALEVAPDMSEASCTSSVLSDSDESTSGANARAEAAVDEDDSESERSETSSESEDSEPEYSASASTESLSTGSDSTGSESDASASSGTNDSGAETGNNGSNAKRGSANSPGQVTDGDIDKLAESVASQCTIEPSLPAEDEKENVEPEGSDSEAISAAEYLEPLEFLANEWRLCTLSLLEYMVRLASIEISEQVSHLEVPDEKLRLYLLAAPAGTSIVPSSIPGGQSLRSTPYRGAGTALDTPTSRRGHSPLPLGVARHQRTPSALGSPAVRAQTRRARGHSASMFETPHGK
ncbi:Ran-specific GTPase-activating protein 30 [Coemansia sp. RSA 2711]|nr:Ran-specific GTPase-activating protein 30 [Coemansia sp. RSA 2711]